MPLITRCLIKAGLASLVCALLIAALLAVPPTLVKLPSAIYALQPVYFHLFMVGWVTQLIFGVAFWMFPKFTKEKPRGSERLGWAVYVLLNLGLILRVLAEPLSTTQPAPVWSMLLVISALCQWFAGAGFVANTWNRVKER